MLLISTVHHTLDNVFSAFHSHLLHLTNLLHRIHPVYFCCFNVWLASQVCGQASVSAAFARFWHLTRGRPLADAAGAKTRGQARYTHSLTCDLLREQGGPVVPLLPTELATRPPSRSIFHHYPSEPVHSKVESISMKHKEHYGVNVELFMYRRPDWS